ncbi:sulfolipid-1 biosynthesis phthioceranic/hydroxyphthioceranic acid synthase [Mycolicibacterium sp. ELW1]|uniref:sulfolipid-1 biosynthesis phthioceranic/hydroxyphthioceranic acid synthase n=1 Tax=Mycobacteriaceae TaxID=1762 RepID=UPI0011ED165C|nr:type I polyketide synthase [Mycobacterium sp. ELW1]QEN13261.1 SDR family NAD(P)-dependent oxidoreductase [Mycobacterium sp. ELW1]
MPDRAETPIAVIGIGCRLPGDIDSPEQLWDALLRGDDLVTEVPPERWDNDEFYDPQPGTPGRTTSKWGAFLRDVAGFDAQFFGVSDREASAMDPQHRLLLETAWEAMEHAGLNPDAVRESLTGVFVGLTHYDYEMVSNATEAMEGPYGVPGNTFALAAGRIAYTLGLRGPAVAVDTACSSGLFAVHAACRSLIDGESDLAFAGGAYVMLDPRKFVAGTAAGHLSPTGRCSAFDVAADGYVGGEASAVVLLKRLADAERDGDRVLAVVRGTAANQDGHTVNISTPSVSAQTAVYRAALRAAGVDAGSVGMVEAHGPGTPVGDPIEFTSLSAVYGIDRPCALASVKTNLGHTQSASGVVGLIKAVLALHHGLVPKNLHFTALPDELARIETNLFVPQETTPWPTDHLLPRRAAVSSYGVSGTNVHAILEQAPVNTASGGSGAKNAPGGDTAVEKKPLLFALSSTSANELRRSAGRLADWVQTKDDVALPDLAYTLARRRAHRPVRTAVVAKNRPELTVALRGVADGDSPFEAAVGQDDRGPVWVFSGQGSQWAQMGAELLRSEPDFAAVVAQIDPLIIAESGFSVTEAMTAPDVVVGIDRVQPTLFTMQVAMATALAARGVRPGAVIGHSMGETAAAVVSGALSLQDGVRVICRRSRLMAGISGSGAMASVELPAKQVLSELTMRGIKDVVVAVVASPQSTVIGGATETVAELMSMWESRDVMARRVAVDVASHTPQVDPILDELSEVLGDITPLTPRVPYYSATGFDPREEPVCNSKYWVKNLRSTVRFSAAVRAAMEDGYRVFAELAPHPLLTHAVEQTAASLDVPLVTLAAMRRNQDAPNGLANFTADLHSAGAAIDFAVRYPHGQLVDAPLPTWTHQRLWLEMDDQRRTGRAHTVSVHPLLGSHVRLPEQPERHVWQADVGSAVHPWLVDHGIGGVPVLPGAAYCEMALAAAQLVLGEGSKAVEVSDLRLSQALPVEEHTTVSTSVLLSAPGVAELTVSSDSGQEFLHLAEATLRSVDDEAPLAGYDLAALTAAHPRPTDGEEVRARLARRGAQYGPAFSGLAAVHVDGAAGSVLAAIALPTQIRSQRNVYDVHPALLDACFQSVEAIPQTSAFDVNAPVLPSGMRSLRSYGGLRNAQFCYTRLTNVDDTGFDADIDVLDGDGTVLLRVDGLHYGTADSGDTGNQRLLRERLLSIDWHRRELPEADHSQTGTWLLVSTGDDDSAVSPLVNALKTNGAPPVTVHCPQSDNIAGPDRITEHLQTGDVAGVVILTAPAVSGRAEADPVARGAACVHHLVSIVQAVLSEGTQVPRLYVVTRNARSVLDTDVPNLEQAGVRGMLRVVGSEYPQAQPTLIDIDDTTDLEHVAAQLLCASPEDETAWRDNTWLAARMIAAPLGPENRHTALAEYGRDGMRLQIRTPGDLTTLESVGYERVAPGAGQIEVAVHASSLNVTDELVAKGQFPRADDLPLPLLGSDFAGVVTAVGPDVTEHRVGDRVGGLSANGCWGTFVTCDARLAIRLPAELSDQQAVAAISTTATAWYGLHEQARISAEDRVLIHSATSGVGQAAIAIARAAGAQIFATAGNDECQQLLHDMGIEHIYDSRSTGFADQIRADTNGYGVDVVLNSLTGPAQRAGLELLAIGGRFVEIGKSDVFGNTRLGLLPFHRNLAFHYLDLAMMSSSHPNRVGRLLSTVFALVADGTMPPADYTTYPLTEAATAIDAESATRRPGTVLLEVPQSGQVKVERPAENVVPFRADGAYIVTGGLGGLGLFLAEKMANGGAGRIVLSSRSQPSRKTLETIEMIRSIGTDVVVACADIADPATAAQLIASATATGLPLRGILHAAAVIDNATVANTTADLIDRDWNAKVRGAWNMHQAVEDSAQSLDWFCSFSSAAALVGSPGQCAYAAANSWLDAFGDWRRAHNRPATTIAWGPWADIGAATTFAENTGQAITPDEGAYAFDSLLRYNRTYAAYAPVIGNEWVIEFARRSPFAERFGTTEPSTTGTTKLRTELDGLPREEWPSRLRRLISDQVSLVLRRTVDPDRPLSEYGVDSLGAMELRTRIETETGIRLTVGDLAVGTVRGLAELLCERIAPSEVSA